MPSIYLGTLLLGAAYLAIGGWVSSFTENQIIAFILDGFGALAAADPVIAADLISGYTASEGRTYGKTPSRGPDEHETVIGTCSGRGELTAAMINLAARSN